MLALQAAAYEKVEAHPLDVLGAQTDGKIGYRLEQELANLLPPARGDDAHHAGRGRRERPRLPASDQADRAGAF